MSRCRRDGTTSLAPAAARRSPAASAITSPSCAPPGPAPCYGISSQDTDYQREVAERLALPFPLLSDTGHRLEAALGLPTFDVDGMHLYRRLTLIVRDGRVEHAFYPIFPPDTHAAQVLAWLQERSDSVISPQPG